MDRINLLRARKDALEKAGKAVRGAIAELFDESSFVELSAFSFSEGVVLGDEPQGEGVVSGFATIGGHPFYVVGQNFENGFGGLTKAHCEKIVKTLEAAEKNCVPVVYLLHSQGVKIGEGVEALEGIAKVLSACASLHGVVPQYAVLMGEVYGAAAAIAAQADAVFFLKESVLAVASPLVLSAKCGKNLKKEEVGGYDALKHSLLPAIRVKDLQEVSALILKIDEHLMIPVLDAPLNEPVPALNESADANTLLSALEDPIELGENGSKDVKTLLARVGGIAVCAVIFDKTLLCAENMKKIVGFARFAERFSLPLVLFADCGGAEPSLLVNDSAFLKEIGAYFETLSSMDSAKISVVTGRAVGLGYSLFAAKSAGYDVTLALSNADISLFENAEGAQIVYQNETAADKEALLSRYEEEISDPVNAAKGGYLDNVIEPQFLKQYLIASLQMLMR